MKKYILVELDSRWISARRLIKALQEGKELTEVIAQTSGYDAPIIVDANDMNREMDITAPLFTLGGDK